MDSPIALEELNFQLASKTIVTKFFLDKFSAYKPLVCSFTPPAGYVSIIAG